MTGIGHRPARGQLWPRRAPGLPPGQRALTTFPRFADHTTRRPPEPDRPVRLTVGAGAFRIELAADDLEAVGPRRQTADFHCVTTWSRRGLAWEGAPLRLVSPTQYGYKSVKHLERLELSDHRPASALGSKEHPRARVDREERHARLPGRLLRVPYRVAIPLTIALAERFAEPASAAGRGTGS